MLELNRGYHGFLKILGKGVRITHAFSGAENNPE